MFDVALDIYGQGGWNGFSFDALAKSASVGKAALYSRWASRGDLLREALAARWISVDNIDNGSLREDLRQLAHSYMQTLTGPHGSIGLMLQADRQYEDVRIALEPYRERIMREARLLVRRAMTRGEIPTDVSPALILDVLIGAVSNRVSATPPQMRARLAETADRFIDDLVTILLRGVSSPQGVDAPGD